MHAIDAATGRCRGYVRMSRSEVTTSLLLTVSRSKLDKVPYLHPLFSLSCPNRAAAGVVASARPLLSRQRQRIRCIRIGYMRRCCRGRLAEHNGDAAR